MTMITPSYLGETIEYSSLHACRSTLEDPTDSLSLRGASFCGTCFMHTKIFKRKLLVSGWSDQLVRRYQQRLYRSGGLRQTNKYK